MNAKRYYALVVALFLIATPAAAQFSIGVIAGVNSAGVDWELNGDSEDTKSLANFLGGVVVDYELADNMAISVQPQIMGKGGKQDETEQFFGSEFQLSYIEIPILFRYLIGSGNIQPFVEAGPSIGFLSSAEVEFSDGDSIDIKDDLTGTDISLVFGAGANVPVGNNTFFGALRIATGLSNIDDGTDAGDELKTKGFQVLFGFKLPLGSR